ncbi:unnamed protein product [Candidula unifasciata]|uniref:BZIP domain-containing protein n=1 Tax=Candidula unifasciata TaxID=100452 RepID=A0A8S3YNN2_9EUPU|nr:unnamed protein product [Candidula unifasciata]
MDSLQLSEFDLQTFFGSNKDYSEQQSLPQVMLDATAVVHQEKYPGEGLVLPPPVVNFLDHGHSPEQSDVTSYYSDDSCATPHHIPEFCQLTSPDAEAPSHNFVWPSCSNVSKEQFFTAPETSNYGLKHEEFAHASCQKAVQPGPSDAVAFPFVTSPTTSLPSPSSTVYSVSSPGTPGPSCVRGRRPHDASAPYSTKSKRRMAEKGTQEYVDKRARNNVAVRKSRAKAKEKQKETEVRVQALVDQNEQLQKKVDMLSKELNVLKGLFMNIGASIPDDFLKAIGDS